MPAPDYPRSGFVSKRTSRVKHVAIVDRKMSKVPFRPLCNAHSESDEIRMVGDRETSAAGEIVWWVDLNGTAFKGKRVCQNCMRVVEELWSAVSGVDTDIEIEKDITEMSIGEWQTRDLSEDPPFTNLDEGQ